MYLFAQHGILSIVKHRDRPGMLMVRAIARDDLTHYFPQVKIQVTPKGDYRYRVTLPSDLVAKRIANAVYAIDYPKVKPSVAADRADAYFAVWSIMMDLQGEH
jgi:hypothetical protein